MSGSSNNSNKACVVNNKYDLYTLFNNFSIHNIFIVPYDICHLQDQEMAKFNCLTKHMYKAHF